MSKRDLFVVVADLDAENAVKTLLANRQHALGIQLEFRADRPPGRDLLRYTGRDAGCYRKAADLLRVPQRTHRHAMLLFDLHGCGADAVCRGALEEEVERKLHASGWPEGDVAVVVLEPELESWVWSSSPKVADVLGWQDERDQLRAFLGNASLWEDGKSKPTDPKEAMKAALKKRKKPLGAQLFADLATNVSVNRCEDPAFQKFKDTLQRWFGFTESSR